MESDAESRFRERTIKTKANKSTSKVLVTAITDGFLCWSSLLTELKRLPAVNSLSGTP